MRTPSGFPAGTLSPAQVLTAYGLKQNCLANAPTLTIGIGSLGGGVVQADIDNAVAAWGMAKPNITVRTVGGAVNDPSDADSTVENSLDLLVASFTWWWLTGKPAEIMICFGPNASNGMTLVTKDLAAAGCKVASWSWGSAASTWDANERAGLAAAFLAAVQAGVTFFAASGDNSVDDGTSAPSADYPCSDPCVWAVGGTKLTLKADGSIALEQAWGDGQRGDEGGGGGFDPSEPMPPYQQGIVPAEQLRFLRGVPDTSANADPNSGWQISANGSWTVVGGTSASSPFTAAVVAAAKATGALGTGLLTPAIYAARATACNDITTGSNGDPATAGWDPATGLGSPKSAGFIQAISGQAAPQPQPQPNPPAPNPPPPVPPAPAPAPVLVRRHQALAWAVEGIVENWKHGMSLSDVQSAADQGLGDNWPDGAITK